MAVLTCLRDLDLCLALNRPGRKLSPEWIDRWFLSPGDALVLWLSIVIHQMSCGSPISTREAEHEIAVFRYLHHAPALELPFGPSSVADATVTSLFGIPISLVLR